MNTENFLRKWFGLKGPFLTKAFRKSLRNGTDLEYDGQIYTDEAFHCWDMAIDLVDDLVALGAINEDTALDIKHAFCGNA